MKTRSIHLLAVPAWTAMLTSCTSPTPAPGGRAEFERRVQAAQQSGKLHLQQVTVTYPDGTTREITPNGVATAPARKSATPR